VVAAALLAMSGACAHQKLIPGTSVEDTEDNRSILQAVEHYRERLVAKNVDGLLVLASERYQEDSGTPRSEDDYGYAGLKEVLTKRLARVRSLRYDIEYRSLKVTKDRAEVQAFIKGAFEVEAESGERYRQVSDYHRFVLERPEKDGRWQFVSGM
jgi:Ni/Co efflux regulator RcnB